jgi:outer membrane protein TolC
MSLQQHIRAKLMGGVVGLGLVSNLVAQAPATVPLTKPGGPVGTRPAIKVAPPDPPPATILQSGEAPIDLGSALRLAGAENAELLFARERISEATARQQLAAAQLLPNLNLGTNYDMHRGTLQQSNGNILNVHRDAMYFGLGASAVAAGTVNIPGLNYNLNVGEIWFQFLITRQTVRTTAALAEARRNDVLLRVCLAYLDLLAAEGRRAVAGKNRTEAAVVAQLTADYAQAGQGKASDAYRASVELRRRDVEQTQAEQELLNASARLCQLLNLDPTTRLKPIDGWVVPIPLVPEPVPLPELVAIALMQRPELAARRSEIQAALYGLSLAEVLPFSPNVILGFSAGGFGGGSDLIAAPQGFIAGNGQRLTGPRFGNFGGRTDVDAVVYWTIRNLGVGNIAEVRGAESRVKQSQFRELETVNLVRSEVAQAHARAAARVLQIDAGEKAVRAASEAYAQDLIRIRGVQGLPLELMDSLRLLGHARVDYLDAIIDYNRAQVQLWVALGRPPADRLARPVPADLVPPPVTRALATGVLPAPRSTPAAKPEGAARP